MYYRYAIASLCDLLAALRDSDEGFAVCAAHAADPVLRKLFACRAQRRAAAARELTELIRQLGGDPGVSGQRPRRGWTLLRELLPAGDDDALVDASEHGDDHALEVYRNALDDHLPELVRQVVLRHFEDAMSDRHEMRDFRAAPPATGAVVVSGGGDARH
jgi:uncharacterized protein (TIGR02284 family)